MNNLSAANKYLHQVQRAPTSNGSQTKNKHHLGGITPITQRQLDTTQTSAPKSLHKNSHNGKSRSWTPQEDALLFQAMEIFSRGSWTFIANHIKTKTGFECFCRWKDIEAKLAKQKGAQPKQQPIKKEKIPPQPIDFDKIPQEIIIKWNNQLNDALILQYAPPLFDPIDINDLITHEIDSSNEDSMVIEETKTIAVAQEADHETTLWLQFD